MAMEKPIVVAVSGSRVRSVHVNGDNVDDITWGISSHPNDMDEAALMDKRARKLA
ncbi:MAG: hypothetical protein U9Q68_10320 [Euryarchaeota archaeon]|nr:hypothetical protein [Euryarchaeota archaeon]